MKFSFFIRGVLLENTVTSSISFLIDALHVLLQIIPAIIDLMKHSNLKHSSPTKDIEHAFLKVFYLS